MATRKNRLFGTDGIRGRANQHPMTPEMGVKIGQAIGYWLKESGSKNISHKVLIGKDTRLSGYMLELALASGLNSMGVDVLLVGPLPTPGIGFLASNMRAEAGIVISASHNPFYDNGIKIFGRDGFKIQDHVEDEIDRLVFDTDLIKNLPTAEGIGRSRRIDDSQGRYIVYTKSTFPLQYTLDGLRIVLDCANGACYKVAPAVFQELGAELVVLGDKPNGLNINDKCGALFPQKICEAVKHYRADVGISLDGDGDRLIMSDEKGNMINGDHILAMCALDLLERKKLTGNSIVATHMSNFGLDKLMEKNGIKVIRTDVGDKYVVNQMRKDGFVLGGEQSGHIIFLERCTTGDGIIAALSVLSVMKHRGLALSQLDSQMIDLPQVLINIRVAVKKDLDTLKEYKKVYEEISKKLEGKGRLFVRYSGTEPVVRILVEGPDKVAITQYAEQLAQSLQKELTDA
ncbi:MAG: phosphoglucosamine mutase [Pseudomonadota bacterium]|nr:phosphoglucosamine mutase [Pseudomonadota bacterium]